MSKTHQDLTTYLRNVVDGVPMRELARQLDVEPSTISRRVKRVEEMREWPEWDVVLDQLALVTCPEGVTEEAVLTAMGVDREDAETSFLAASVVMSQTGAVLAVTDAPGACVFMDGEVAHRVSKRLATTWLALEWVKEHLNGKVRRYVISGRYGRPEPAEEPRAVSGRPYARYTTETTENIARMRQMRVGAKQSRFGFTADQVALAIDLTTLMTTAEARGKDSAALRRVVKLKEQLGEDLFNVIYDFLHAGAGFEAIEKRRGYPARSAKVLLGVALDQITHFGLDEGLAVMGGVEEAGAGHGPNEALAAATAGSGGRPVRPVHAAE